MNKIKIENLSKNIRKKRDIVFSIILITLIAIGVYFMYIKDEATDTSQTDNMTLSSDELASLDDTLQKEQESLLAEREEFIDKCLEVSLNPEYHYTKDTKHPTNNKDFIKEQCKFRNIIGMVDYEFVGYEELDNLSEYAEGIDWDNRDKLWKKGWDYYTKSLYLDTGLMNRDGTFNLQKRILGQWNEEEGFKAEKEYDNCELVAVKITMRYTNLSVKENEVYFKDLHDLRCKKYTDDGELVSMADFYVRNIFFETYDPIYRSISWERHPVEKGELGNFISTNSIILQPYEEYTCDLIYVVFKDEFENMCFTSHFGLNGDSLNYKDLGTNIVMFSYLKEALGGKK